MTGDLEVFSEMTSGTGYLADMRPGFEPGSPAHIASITKGLEFAAAAELAGQDPNTFAYQVSVVADHLGLDAYEVRLAIDAAKQRLLGKQD